MSPPCEGASSPLDYTLSRYAPTVTNLPTDVRRLAASSWVTTPCSGRLADGLVTTSGPAGNRTQVPALFRLAVSKWVVPNQAHIPIANYRFMLSPFRASGCRPEPVCFILSLDMLSL